jgi:hypothetical protein
MKAHTQTAAAQSPLMEGGDISPLGEDPRH